MLLEWGISITLVGITMLGFAYQEFRKEKFSTKLILFTSLGMITYFIGIVLITIHIGTW